MTLSTTSMEIKDSLFGGINDEINDVIVETSEEVSKELTNNISSINYIKGFASAKQMSFSEPVCLANDDLNLPGDMGVYLIFCKNELFYVGYGMISSRVLKFKRALKSNEDGSHNGAVKSKKENSNILDYYVSYIKISNEFLARKLETHCIEMYSPKFAETSQAGK